LWRESLAVVRQ